ncbi:MAG: beta-N-acetylhexosaminidase, partial [Muribaculaceae bacterium]|nr:beta-N-acetylhexosaminidase [Muribaculaceae bacterium]
MNGQMLHSVTDVVPCNIPPGESRNINRQSWDRQRSFFYHKNPPYRPRTVATPFDVVAKVNYALTVPAGTMMPTIVPLPASVNMTGSNPFVASSATVVNIPDKKLAREMVPRLSTTPLSSYEVKKGGKGALGAITFSVDPSVEGNEAYKMSVTSTGVDIKASTADGLYYGAITLGEMLNQSDTVPAMTIEDKPRFPYRGMMIDVSRHFHGFDFLKKQVDVMARLKLNNLHLHLTDAAGWRMEIERYPLLTEVAAWRPDSTWEAWSKNGARYCSYSEKGAYGGFFRKAQLREFVEYAALRGITVITEIEMPGNSAE